MITQNQKDILKKYADLKKGINILENQAEDLKKEVLNILQENELGEISIGNDKISIGSRRAWVYPEQIKVKEKELKAEKKESEQLGTAKYTENFYPIFSDSDNKKEKNYE